jgi:hypothetical protein
MKMKYYVKANIDERGRVLGYGVYFEPVKQPGINVEVDAGYFEVRGKQTAAIALYLANMLRDDLNKQIA